MFGVGVWIGLPANLSIKVIQLIFMLLVSLLVLAMRSTAIFDDSSVCNLWVSFAAYGFPHNNLLLYIEILCG